MRAKNQAFLAAAGYSNTGYSNTGAPAVPNLGRTTRISFPTEDESSIGRRTMKRGLGSTLLPGVLAYLTESDLPMLVAKTTKERRGRGAAAATKDDELADAQLATAAGMSHGKAFDKIIEKEAIAAAGETSKTNPAEDAGEDLAEEGEDSGSEEGEGAASESDDEAAPPAAAVGGAAAAAIAAELREEEAAEPPVAAAAEGGAAAAAAAAPADIIVPHPGENTVEAYLTTERSGVTVKAGTLNTLLAADSFGAVRHPGDNSIVALSNDMTELQALRVKLEKMRESFANNPKGLALIRAGLTAVRLKIRVSAAEPYRVGGGAGPQARAAEVAARARSASPLGPTAQARLDARGVLAAARQMAKSPAARNGPLGAEIAQAQLNARGTLAAIGEMDAQRGRQAAEAVVALAKAKNSGRKAAEAVVALAKKKQQGASV